MASATLTATPRAETGKGAARSLRRAGQIPGVVYGHARQPQPLAIDARDLEKLLDRVSASTVIDLTVGSATTKTLIRELQRHPFRRQVLHVDFQELVAGEKVTVAVPLRFVGTADGVRNGGGILTEAMHELTVYADPSSIPDHIDVDISALAMGHALHVSEIPLPAGVEVEEDPNAVVAAVSAPSASMLTPTDVPVIPEAPAEPELIRKAKEDEEA